MPYKTSQVGAAFQRSQISYGWLLCGVEDDGAATVTFCGATTDDCSVSAVESSRLSVGVGGTSLPVSSTTAETVLPSGVDGELVAIHGGLREAVKAVWRPGCGKTVSERSASSMVVLSANVVSAVAVCRATIVLRSASTAASFTLATLPIGKHSLREFAVDDRCLRVRIIEPVVISSPNPSS